MVILALMRFPQFSAEKLTEVMFLVALSPLSSVISKLVTHFLYFLLLQKPVLSKWAPNFRFEV